MRVAAALLPSAQLETPPTSPPPAPPPSPTTPLSIVVNPLGISSEPGALVPKLFSPRGSIQSDNPTLFPKSAINTVDPHGDTSEPGVLSPKRGSLQSGNPLFPRSSSASRSSASADSSSALGSLTPFDGITKDGSDAKVTRKANPLLSSSPSSATPSPQLPRAPRGRLSLCYTVVSKTLAVEDNANLLVSLALFTGVVLLSLTADLFAAVPLALQIVVFGVAAWLACAASCALLQTPYAPKDWMTLIMAVFLANQVGAVSVLRENGVGSALWAILLGIAVQVLGFDLRVGLKAEYFIKIGIILGAINMVDLLHVGSRGLLVAWVDTILLLIVLTWVISATAALPFADAITTVGAATICGSSAAAAISSVVKAAKANTQLVIAVVGVANIPLIPLLPRFAALLPPRVMGSWIGGSVDSTGQVIACASICTDTLSLPTATVIKVAQNILIGPICFALALFVERRASVGVLLDKFPRFVLGFLLTSTIVSFAVPPALSALAITNSSYAAEWFSLCGFVLIGVELSLKDILANPAAFRILGIYAAVQTVDLCSTLGWSILAFGMS